MDLKTLEIDVGGLCMLVQNTEEPAGLFILLPKHHHVHCSLFVVEGAFTEDKKPHLAHLDKVAPLDLRGYATNANPRPLSKSYLRFSRFVNPPLAVEAKWLTDQPTGVLNARVALPLDAAEDSGVFTDRATLYVPDAQEPTVLVTGQTRFRIKVRVPYIARLEIAGLTLLPDANGLIRFSVLNIRGKDFPGRKYKRSKGDKVDHVQAYYRLLKGWPQMQDGPDITVGADQDGQDDNLPDISCSAVKPDQARMRFVDPYNCTIGFGCPPNQANC